MLQKSLSLEYANMQPRDHLDISLALRFRDETKNDID